MLIWAYKFKSISAKQKHDKWSGVDMQQSSMEIPAAAELACCTEASNERIWQRLVWSTDR